VTIEGYRILSELGRGGGSARDDFEEALSTGTVEHRALIHAWRGEAMVRDIPMMGSI